jgi:CheY-like chemotaxis protein
MTTNLKVLVCDDHELIREGLKRILLDTGKAGRVGEASTASEAVAAVRAEAWDIVILDINLGGRSGLEVLKEIKAEFRADFEPITAERINALPAAEQPAWQNISRAPRHNGRKTRRFSPGSFVPMASPHPPRRRKVGPGSH